MSKTLTMSPKELERMHLLRQHIAGTLSLEEVADQIGVSARHTYRLKSSFLEHHEEGLIHGLRGRPSNHAYPTREREEIIELYRTRYRDYGPTLFAERLAADRDIVLDAETLRRWLIAAGLWEKHRVRSRHRKQRPRRSAIGAMVQLDGSFHPWFEERADPCCLLVYVDDASNRTYAQFSKEETIEAVLSSCRDYVRRYGIPAQFYTDRKNVYWHETKTTEFVRISTHLRIEHILAHSPQAKGRVERMNRTLQDRLVKALREKHIREIDEANHFLENEFLPAFNATFARTDGLIDVHRPARDLDLDNVFCIEATRFVHHDMTFQYGATTWQIHRTGIDLPFPRQHVTVRRWLDGSLHAFWHEHELQISACACRPKPVAPPVPHPADNHPWRRAAPIGKAKRKSIAELCGTSK